jgi:PTH1 family peptidyl-tRNA hydrolase
VGFWFADSLAAGYNGEFRVETKFHGLLCRLNVGVSDLRILKPTTFMNRSGQSLGAVARYFDIRPDQILVAHDELDLPVGSARFKQGGGHAGHNGLRDIINVLGSRDFWRLRIGIDHPGNRQQVVNYVLNRPSKEEGQAIIDVLDDAQRCLGDLLDCSFQKAMNRLHSPR